MPPIPPLIHILPEFTEAPPELFEVRWGERWEWAKKHTRGLAWKNDALDQVLLLVVGYLTFRGIMSPNSLREWLITSALGLVYYLGAVPLGALVGNLLVRSRGGVIEDRLRDVALRCATLQAKLDAFEHRKPETYAALVTAYRRLLEVRDQSGTASRPDMLNGIRWWLDETLAALEGKLPAHYLLRLTDNLGYGDEPYADEYLALIAHRRQLLDNWMAEYGPPNPRFE
jgi:hypothetical protein